MGYPVCIMVFLQDYESENPVWDSRKAFSSADFLAAEFGNSLFNPTQSSPLIPIIKEFGERLIWNAGRIRERGVEAKG